MYIGKMGDHLTMRVPQANCFPYVATSTGKDFVEVRLPDHTPDTWYSFIVEPDQVFYDSHDPEHYNIIEEINRKTRILVTQKHVDDNGERTTVKGTAKLYDPEELKRLFQ